MEQRKLKRINIRNIFKITIDVDVKPKWTDKQWGWMRKGVKLKSLFSNNLKTIARIDDFRRKYLMSYWKKMAQKQPKCELCGKEWHREHLFDDCEVVEKWENKIYGWNIGGGLFSGCVVFEVSLEEGTFVCLD